MRWVIELECEPNAEQLGVVVATVENACDFLMQALIDMEVPDPAVETSLRGES